LEGQSQHGEDQPQDVAPLLPVGDPVAGRAVGQGEGQADAEGADQGEEGLEVEEEGGDLQRLGLGRIEEALRLGHGQDPPRRWPIVTGALLPGPAGAAWRVRNCPQAASMSVPRLRRIVALTPPARRRPAKAATRRGGLAGAPDPTVDTVRWRAEIPRSSWRRSTAAQVAS